MPGQEMLCGILKKLPVGVGFHPTDQQLVNNYLSLKIRGMNSELKMKILGNDSQVDIIPELDLCECDPLNFPAQLNHPVFSVFQTDHPEWFFFSPLHKKYPNGSQRKRVTKAGYWKPTGPDREIKGWNTERVIGTKKTLVFHKGSGRSACRTGWIIHEYHAVMPSLPDNIVQKTYILCRLKNETGSRTRSETNFNSMSPEMPLNQETSLMNMEVDNPSTGIGILHNVPANIMTSGADQSHCASNLASDIRNYELDMTTEQYAMLDGPDFAIDPDGFPYGWTLPSPYIGNSNCDYIVGLSICPRTPLKRAYGEGGGPTSDTHTQVAQAEVQMCNGKGSSNFSDTASAGHQPSSLSGYLVNSLLGMLLLVILIAVMVRDIHAKFSKLWF